MARFLLVVVLAGGGGVILGSVALGPGSAPLEVAALLGGIAMVYVAGWFAGDSDG